MEDVDKFDYAFFNISKSEAEQMDPRQRILLETVYHTLEDAGYCTGEIWNSDTSIFVGDVRLDYYHHADQYNSLLHIGNMNGVVAGRIARNFNLRGKAVMVDTACSSSLVGITQACDDLILRNANLALAAGININLFPNENMSNIFNKNKVNKNVKSKKKNRT